ncbi:unnamed protein product [Prorocentrum cordatum]|uniref:Uncharacterized protein n=1 Tax=Prorocentrum cordatum TaxID=2364126 RepID=A0ABN9S0G0_9DINO|nr:unnamed protein product [Polarella glacialis]
MSALALYTGPPGYSGKSVLRSLECDAAGKGFRKNPTARKRHREAARRCNMFWNMKSAGAVTPKALKAYECAVLLSSKSDSLLSAARGDWRQWSRTTAQHGPGNVLDRLAGFCSPPSAPAARAAGHALAVHLALRCAKLLDHSDCHSTLALDARSFAYKAFQLMAQAQMDGCADTKHLSKTAVVSGIVLWRRFFLYPGVDPRIVLFSSIRGEPSKPLQWLTSVFADPRAALHCHELAFTVSCCMWLQLSRNLGLRGLMRRSHVARCPVVLQISPGCRRAVSYPFNFFECKASHMLADCWRFQKICRMQTHN